MTPTPLHPRGSTPCNPRAWRGRSSRATIATLVAVAALLPAVPVRAQDTPQLSIQRISGRHSFNAGSAAHFRLRVRGSGTERYFRNAKGISVRVRYDYEGRYETTSNSGWVASSEVFGLVRAIEEPGSRRDNRYWDIATPNLGTRGLYRIGPVILRISVERVNSGHVAPVIDVSNICLVINRSDGRAGEPCTSGQVGGSSELSVADAEATEGDDAALDFTVTLDPSASDTVTVDYATSEGTATAGVDYTHTSGTLTFIPGVNLRTVSVPIIDDNHDDGGETLTLTLSSPSGPAHIVDGTATGTINNDDEAPNTPLTAEFLGLPEDGHDGSTAFDFELKFSEEPYGLGYVTLRDSALAVTHGEVTGVRRLVAGKNRRWEITVDPAGSDDVTIALPATTDCAAPAAICTEDGRRLSSVPPATVAGPATTPAVSVSDASASEGDAVEFTVSLSSASSQQVTVDYATSGGTATSGTDFRAESGTLTFPANQTSRTVSVSSTDDSLDEQDETFTLTLSSPANATLGNGAATGTIIDDDDAPPPLTAAMDSVPASHDGTAFTFELTFSEEPYGLSYVTLRDHAFDVTGGQVREARRQRQGSNLAWYMTVAPGSASSAVTITLPETTDCNATGAICTEDDRPLSHSLADTVDAASASAGDAANGDIADDGPLAIVDGVTPDEAAAALFGEGTLSEARLAALDRLGNRNGRYDLGDLLSWIERCRRGDAQCGTVPTDLGSASSATLLAAAAAGRRGHSRRPRQRDPGRRGRSPGRGGRRRAGMARHALAILLAAATAWSCMDNSVGPPAPASAVPDPGLLTVEWTAPPGSRTVGVLLELEGPGIEAVRAMGHELYQAQTPGSHRMVVAGDLGAGPLVRFRVPDRGQLALYRVRVIEVTGEDYGLRDVGEYGAVIRPH